MGTFERNVVCAIAVSILLAGAAQAERSTGYAGIGLDVEIARVLDEIETDNAKQAHLEQALSGLQEHERMLRTALTAKVRALYRITRSGMTPMGGGFEAIRQHVARVRRLRLLVQHDARALQASKARAAAARTQSEQMAASLSHARARLQALQQQETIAAIQTAPSRRATSGHDDAFYGLRFSDGDSRPSEFASQRGKLAVPITGEVRVVDARRSESDGPGLEFQAAVGTPVRAAAAGRVAFCDHYGSYGQLVIVDHGGGYYTAYGGLGNVEVRVGDELSAYARIGAIGTPQQGAQPSLFFEVRKGTRALPPRAWLGL